MSASVPFTIRGRRSVALALALVGALAATASAHGQAGAHGRGAHGRGQARAGKVLYVAPSGSDAATCTRTAPCQTIGHAVAVARRGATVIVLAGTYAEQVTVSQRLSLVGRGRAAIDATGKQNGIVVSGGGAAGSLVRGFVVEHADQEGILATSTSHVTIRDNVVQGNDLGAAAASPVGECAPQGQVPGDCGEGVHLMSVTHAKVTGNLVTGNSGGILLTDELGPTAHNQVSRNRVLDNLFDCGITIAGHNGRAVQNGQRMRAVGGIYANLISDNVSNGNGIRGEGAGILLAGAGPGTGVYDNVVKHNTANGNNLAGITLHSHAPGDDLNGNRIVNNRVRNDGLGGDPDAGVRDTVGILVFSAVSPLKRVVVRGNSVRDVHFGIWTQNAPKIPAGANHFANVAVPLHQQ